MDIKVGDEVLVESRWNKCIATVVKITPKGFIRTSNGGYYDERGYEKSSDAWGTSRISLLTSEKKEELIKEKTVVDVIKMLHDIKTLSYENAIKIKEILDS